MRAFPALWLLFALLSRVPTELIAAPRRRALEILPKDPTLEILRDATSELPRPAAEVDPLRPLPRLDAEEEHNRFGQDDAPFPGDARVLEDDVVDHRDVQRWEDSDEAGDDGPEQELVAPDVDHPLRKVLLALRLHAEEGPPHVNHFPGEEEREPRQAGEAGRARTEDGVALLGVGVVAELAEVAVAEAVEDQSERGKTQSCRPEAVYKHVEHYFEGEDATLKLSIRLANDINTFE